MLSGMIIFSKTNPQATNNSLVLHAIALGSLLAFARWYVGRPQFLSPTWCFVAGAATGWLVEWQYDDGFEEHQDAPPS